MSAAYCTSSMYLTQMHIHVLDAFLTAQSKQTMSFVALGSLQGCLPAVLMTIMAADDITCFGPGMFVQAHPPSNVITFMLTNVNMPALVRTTCHEIQLAQFHQA